MKISFKKINTRLKIFLLIGFIGFLPIIGLFFYVNFSLKPSVYDNEVEILYEQLNSFGRNLISPTEKANDQLLILSQTPSLLAWVDSNETDANEFNKTKDFVFQNAKIIQYIAQVRYLNSSGYEKIRCNINMNGSIVFEDDSYLQIKEHRDYFQDTKDLLSGEIYTSHINLNIENKQVEIVDGEYVPVIRFATPIYHKEVFSGIIVFNYYFEPIFENCINEIVHHYQKINYAMIDNNGYYLFNSKSKIWTSKENLNTNESFFDTLKLNEMDEIKSNYFKLQTKTKIIVLFNLNISFWDDLFDLSLVVELDNKELTSSIDKSLNILFILITSITLIGWFIAFKLTIKSLSGFVRICAVCKNIHGINDKWTSFEHYISERADIRFSHGYCDSCYDTTMKEIID
ncbi:MAG: hypothetical protein ACXAD7_20745 [Candidatus Kariarchaeaceae archaeon]